MSEYLDLEYKYIEEEFTVTEVIGEPKLHNRADIMWGVSVRTISDNGAVL